MSTRLQILLDEADMRRLKAAARRERVTVSEIVRRALDAELKKTGGGDVHRKLAAIRRAAEHRAPAPDIDQMLAEIEGGYTAG